MRKFLASLLLLATLLPFSAMANDPIPEPSVVVSPQDGATGINNPCTITWTIGSNTNEIQVLLGTQYPPTDVLLDWTSQNITSKVVNNLVHNKTYFVQVNGRNSAGTTQGIVSGFTTVIDPVTGFTVVSDKLYPGDAAIFNWDINRSFRGYNLYKDGVKVNEELITETTYAVEGLTYNMSGYNFQISNVYDEGESALSSAIKVYMTGNGTVAGTVFEQDSITALANAKVTFYGTDAYQQQQTFVVNTDDNGRFELPIFEGLYNAYASAHDYADCPYDGEINVVYNQTISGVNIYLHEVYTPLGTITAEVVEDNVEVNWEWGLAEELVDFETGDFSQANFNNQSSSYPWAITTTSPYEGTYCMKSTCEGVASGVSSIEAIVEVPFDAKMGFQVKTSTESGWDKFHFYIDGAEQGQALSGDSPYTYKEFSVTEGTHTYKWEYAKDASLNSGDDCVYVDNIVMYREDVPLPPIPGGQSYDFEDGTFMGWTALDADGDGFNWELGSSLMGSGYGHEYSSDLVLSQSYDNTYGVLYPDNYLIAPAKIAAQNGALINFWACAQDASYAQEHFGVAVSTGSATAADFTTIQEWNMSSKGMGRYTPVTRSGNRAQGTWYQYTVDLSAYAGQEIWVAIRHFNCSDWFYLDVDDITLTDGSAKGMADNRSFQHFNLYRRNNLTEEQVLIATPNDTTFNYTDTQWNDLPAGEYQWGIQAYYEGNAATDRNNTTYSFEGTMDGWTTIDADNDGYSWQLGSVLMAGYSIPSHDGEDCVSSASYMSSTGALTPDNYLVSPQKAQYSQISFWACAQDPSYASEHYGVAVSTTGNTNGSDFTTIAEWTMSAKTTDNTGNYMRRGRNNREGTWYQKTVDLSAYAGQDIWVAIRHFNCTDWFYLDVDEVVLSQGGDDPNPPTPPTPPTPGEGPGMSDIIWSNTLEKDMYSTVTINVALNSGQPSTGATVELTGEQNYNATLDETSTVVFENVHKGTYALTVALDGFESAYNETPVTFTENEETINVTLYEIINNIEDLYVSTTGWAMWSGATPGGDTPTPPGPNPPTPGEGDWYYYDDGTYGTSIGTGGGQFSWGVMFPAGSYQGNTVTKVSAYNASSYPMTGTVTIYNDGASAPASPVGEMNITFAGIDDFTEFEFATPVTINPSKNLWVVFYNASGATYPAAASNDVSGDANGRWVSIDGVEWMDLATAGVPGYTWMIRAYVANGAKGEVTEISVPQRPHDGGKLAAVKAPIANKGDRAPLVYKLMLDGTYAGDTPYAGFQFDCEGFEEGSEHVARVLPVYATGEGEWAEFTWTYRSCENFPGLTEEPSAVWQGDDVVLNWVLPEGGDTPPTPPNPPTPGEGDWYYYDNGVYGTSIGTGGGQFSWGVMFPAGSYEGDMVTKVAAYNAANYPMTGTVTIYNDGASAPASPVGEMNISFAGTDDFTEFEFATPVTVNSSKNLWVVFYNASGATYPAAASEDVSGDANGRWVSIDGVEWMDLATAGVPGYSWMIRAYVANGAKGEVTGISVPQRPHSGGKLVAVNGRSRDEVTYDFEDGSMQGWTSLDADNDGFGWNTSTSFGGHNSSTGLVYSQSYDNTYGVLYPDNYLISPAKAEYPAITFYACAQDASYAQEHFGVAVSTGGATAADFTTIQEWTMSAKSVGAPTSVTRSGNRAQGTWREYTVDLSAYAGQQIWVAIRHFNCSDWFYLDVDDITMSGDAPLPPDPPTPGDVYDFEDGTMQGWTSLDADNDGFGWNTSTSFGGHNSSTGLVYSQSYDNTYGVLYPDNYLISPAKAEYPAITFYACAQDASYAQEHFGVAVSTGGATAADFTTIQEWTMSAKSVGAPTSVTRSGNRAQGTWHEYTVDLSAYAGQDIWVAIRHFNCSDMFYLDVDDISLDGEGGTPNPPLPEGNVIGAMIFRNGEWIAEVAAPTMTYTDVNPGEAGEYEIRVIYGGDQFNGNAYVGEYYAMSCPMSCYPGEATCDAPENLAGEYVWEGNNNFGAQISWTYGEAPSSDIDIDFENGTMGNWTQIDADGDGNGWRMLNEFGGTGHNNSSDGVFSQSYDNSVGALTPDNYLVSPQTPLGGTFSFWACAQDAAWAAEHFGVAVSTAGNTSAADFTTVEEWTMTAKSNTRPSGPRGQLEQGTWYQYTVNLSAFAGQTGYIAIRHFNSTDWFYLDVDDITYTLGKRAGDPVNFAVYRDGSQIATVPYTGAYSYTYLDNIAAGNYEYQVKALYEDCESDFALTANGQNYVTVNVTAVDEISDRISIYPNPTNSNVTIEAAGMNRITVVSALGQVVYDAAVNADNVMLNLGQFKAGIYMVRISTEAGVSVKRVTVVE